MVSEDVVIQLLNSMENSVRATGLYDSSYVFKHVHHDVDRSGETDYVFALTTESAKIAIMFRLCEDVLLLEIAQIDRPHIRTGVLSAAVAVCKEYSTELGVTKFGAAGVVTHPMEQWCTKYGMRRLDGAERWGTVRFIPVDYLVSWET